MSVFSLNVHALFIMHLLYDQYIYIYMVDSHESDAYRQKNDFVAQS